MAMRCLPGPARTPVYVSPGVLGLTGYTGDDVLAGRIALADRIHAEDRPAVIASAARALAERSSGTIEYRFFTRDDRERCLLDADGAVKFVDLLAIDITAQKRAERDKLQLERRILENRHLESLSLLAGGIAHDFNNLLTAISGNATLIALDLDPDSPVTRHLSEIQSAVARAGELCTHLLGFAGGGSHDIQRTDLRALIEECAPVLPVDPASGIRLDTEFGETVPEVLADRDQLHEVLGHLVSNAVDSFGGRPGVIVLTAREALADDTTWENAVLTPGNREGHFALLECRDTGAGMSDETRVRIFDPFFSTKHEGRGLGLPAVLGIVRSHQGGIVVSSRSGEGTAFRIYLPAIQPAPAAAAGQSEAPDPEAVRPRRCLLVVDDEASVRGVIRRLLERHGYEILEASDGEAGIAAFLRDAHRIELVLLDLTMPRVGGEEVLRRIRLTHPRTPVILMSGYSRANTPLLLADGSVTRFLGKPFSLAQMQEQIRRFLG
jgi:signal transduction histidine kinase/CheY-like chemotaxis protein